jgi:hypothetical protein
MINKTWYWGQNDSTDYREYKGAYLHYLRSVRGTDKLVVFDHPYIKSQGVLIWCRYAQCRARLQYE